MDLNVLFEGCSKLKWFAVLNLLIFTFCFGISCWYLRGRLERDVSDFKFMISVAGMNIALDLEKIQELSAGDKKEDSSSNGEMAKFYNREFLDLKISIPGMSFFIYADFYLLLYKSKNWLF